MLCLLGTGYLNMIGCWYAKLPQRSKVVSSNKVLAKRFKIELCQTFRHWTKCFVKWLPTWRGTRSNLIADIVWKRYQNHSSLPHLGAYVYWRIMALAADRLWSRYIDIGSIVTTDQSSSCFRHHVGASAKNTRQEWQKTTELETCFYTKQDLSYI